MRNIIDFEYVIGRAVVLLITFSLVMQATDNGLNGF